MADYQATLKGVLAFAPHADIADTTEPSTGDVTDTYIPSANSEVSLAVGRTDHLDPDVMADVQVRARTLVEKRAAVLLLITQSPEQAMQSSSYANVLQSQFEAEKVELAEIVARGGNVPERGSMTPTKGVSWSPPAQGDLTEERVFLDAPYGVLSPINPWPWPGDNAGAPL